MTDLKLSNSEEQALLALAAKSPLRGDKRTDAKAGIIHAPTAMRLVAKGLAGKKEAFGSYVLLPAGQKLLPGATALQPTEPRDCRKYLGKTLKGQQVILCDKPENHEGDCDNEALKPLDDGHGVVIEAAKLGKAPKAKVESRAAIVARTKEAESKALIDGLPESTRRWAQECADAAIGKKPKAKSEDAAPANVDVPAVIREAMTAPKDSPAPAVLADALEPGTPAPKFADVTAETDRLVRLLHESGTLWLRQDGKTFRINAQNRGFGFEYWMQTKDGVGWSRLPLGRIPAVLAGVEFINNDRQPGVQPFKPARGSFQAEATP